MIRLSEEQRGILNCYSGTKEEVITELQKAIPFIEDLELRLIVDGLLSQIKKREMMNLKQCVLIACWTLMINRTIRYK